MELYFKLNKNDDLGLFSQPAINHEECKSNHLSPIPGLGQIHLPLTDGLNVTLKNFFVFHLNSMKIGEVVVIYMY